MGLNGCGKAEIPTCAARFMDQLIYIIMKMKDIGILIDGDGKRKLRAEKRLGLKK